MAGNFAQTMEGYAEIEKQIAVLRKHGIDYTTQKGIWREAVECLHPRRLQLCVSEIIKESDTVSTLRLVTEGRSLPPFQAGQYINLLTEIDGIHTGRPYSISSAPYQTAYYDITVKRIANGFVSDYLLDRVKVGDTLISSGPAGHFYYNPLFHGDNLVLIAGGSGITPFMSMIREVTDQGLTRRIHLLYGCRKPEEAIFNNELSARAEKHTNFKYDLVISEPSSEYEGLRGFINAELIEKLALVEGSMFYLCGPAEMYKYVTSALNSLGIPKRRIRNEALGANSQVRNDPAWPSEVSTDAVFSIHFPDGQLIQAQASESLLTSMERAGMAVENCCRSGECSLCRVKLISGKVFQSQGALVRQSDRKAGYIHSCAAYPLSDLEILI